MVSFGLMIVSCVLVVNGDLLGGVLAPPPALVLWTSCASIMAGDRCGTRQNWVGGKLAVLVAGKGCVVAFCCCCILLLLRFLLLLFCLLDWCLEHGHILAGQ